MPKLIVTSRYLKKGAVKKLQNYVKYIATREGSVPVKENSGNEPATEKQCELLERLMAMMEEADKEVLHTIIKTFKKPTDHK